MLDKEKECTACSGSGRYCGRDCGACNGTGLEYSKDDIIEALESEIKRLQNTASSRGYTKCTKANMDSQKCHAYNNGECMNAFVCE